MKLSDYKNFIKLFPTENSGYKIKKQNWLGTDQAKLIETRSALLNEIYF